MRSPHKASLPSLLFLLLSHAVLAAASAGSNVAAKPDPKADAKADAIVREAMSTHRIPGVVLGVMHDGRVLKATAYGYANLEWKVPLTADALFQSGSVAKQFAATAVMMLVNEGKLRLDEPISKYLPEASEASWKAVTIRQLLTHTSGIPDLFSDNEENEYDKGILDFRRDYTEAELLARYVSLPLDFPPGEQWKYSNTGYEILGFLIHRVTGKFYGDVLRERIFGPLGMSETRIISEQDIVPRRVSGYRIVHGEIKNQEWMAPSLNTTADGSFYITVFDLAKWNTALHAGKVVPKATLDEMRTPVRLKSGETYPYGFGLEMADKDGHPVVYHTGSNQGFTISLSQYVNEQMTVIVLTNLDSSHSVTLEIAEPVASLYLGSATTGSHR